MITVRQIKEDSEAIDKMATVIDVPAEKLQVLFDLLCLFDGDE